MELAAYIYDAWAYEQAQLDSSDADLLTCDAMGNPKSQDSRWNLGMQRWRSYVLSVIAITGMSSLNLSFSQTAEATQYPEPSVNTAPWCDNLYLCNTSYILEVQTLLAQQGFAVGEIDGVYGSQTKRAVITFQKSQGSLVIDGIPGAKTLALLRNAIKDGSSNSVSPSPKATSRDLMDSAKVITPSSPQFMGFTEDAEVGNLQILLKQRGFYHGVIDGQQGQATTEAIWKAQKAYGLPLDGFAGPLTIRALLAGGTNVPLSLPAFSSTSAANKTDEIEKIQVLLQKRGFYDGAINGQYDLRTRNSIVDAQIAYGQKNTGDISPELVVSLDG
ncbi:MAG: peptidoglycan-binding domain-containing protein, partial [Pseudanabaena sp.]